MSVVPSVIEGPYLRDILEQPSAVQRTIEALGAVSEGAIESFGRQLRAGVLRRVLLVGMGSSFHALASVTPRLSARAIAWTTLETSELISDHQGLLDETTLLVVVSQSGRGAEIGRLIEGLAERTPTIAITNDAGSPLAQWADVTVSTRAGLEATVSCKTYVCTLLALDSVCERLCHAVPDDFSATAASAATAMQTYLEACPAHVAGFGDLLGGVHQVFIVGRGPSLATAGTAGLIIKEATRFPAEGMSAAAFRHGPLECVGPGVLVLVMEGAPGHSTLNQRLAVDIQAAGGRAVLVRTGDTASNGQTAPGVLCLTMPHVLQRHKTLIEILPAQMLSLALSARAGREAGVFARATKITTIE